MRSLQGRSLGLKPPDSAWLNLIPQYSPPFENKRAVACPNCDSGVVSSEPEPGDQRARAARKYGHPGIGLDAARRGEGVDDAKPGRIDPRSLCNCVLRVRRGWVWQQGPVKDVNELGSNLEAHPFL